MLTLGERQLCIDCMASLDETRCGSQPDNPTERLLAGRMPLQAAMSMLAFRKGNTVQATVHAMKFGSGSELCLLMGRQLGLTLQHTARFDDVDVLVPVPLHWRRRLQRGYNQSELLCRGIAEVMPRPVVTGAVVRQRYTRQQSLQSGATRADNVEGAFRLRQSAAVAGQHVLLVDDVVTTGATLAACADALLAAPNLRLSVASLCIAS